MTKSLSQEEIDRLLEVRGQVGGEGGHDPGAPHSITAAGMEKQVDLYNFKRPRLLAQDQIRAINQVHESFARDFSVYLSAQLRTIVNISLTAVDQVLYSEYVMSSTPPSALYVVAVLEASRNIVVELDPLLIIFTIEKLCGGKGEFLQEPRAVSQIEQRIMSKVMSRMFQELERAWQQVYEIQLEEVAFESNAEFVQIIPGVESVILVTFEVTVYEHRSFINICYPYLVLEPMMRFAGKKRWISSTSSEVPPAVREHYEDTLRTMIVQLHAELGRTRLPISELMQLEVGDVIPLEGRVNEPVRVFVGKEEKFTAVAGRSGKYRALRILDVLESQLIQEDDEL